VVIADNQGNPELEAPTAFYHFSDTSDFNHTLVILSF
jgi:hypothetical protein